MHVCNVPLLAAADLDTERIYQYEMRKSCGRPHHHLRRHPAPEAGANQHCIVEPELSDDIEVEIGEIVERAGPVDQRGVAIAGMPRRDYPISPGQEFEPRPLRCQPFTRVQKQEWAAITAFHQVQGRVRDRYRLDHLTSSGSDPAYHRRHLTKFPSGFVLSL